MNFNVLDFKTSNNSSNALTTELLDREFINVNGDTMTGNLTCPDVILNGSSLNSTITNITDRIEIVEAGALIPVGTIIQGFWTDAPIGYLFCLGQQVSKTTYANLYNIIGDTFASFNNPVQLLSGNFWLPDFKGAFFRHSGRSSYYNEYNGGANMAVSIDMVREHRHIYETSTGTKQVFGGVETARNNTSGNVFTGYTLYDPTDITTTHSGGENRPYAITCNYAIKY